MIYNPYTPQNQDRREEWTESAENEPTTDCDRCGTPFSALAFEGIICPECVEREWQDKGDEQYQDTFQQVEQARLVKPTGPCVVEIAHDGVHWRL